MKRIILCLILLNNFLFADIFKLSLVEFVDLFQIKTNKTFILNEKLENENIYIVFQKNINSLDINDFRNLLSKKGLKLFKFDNYYYIDYFNNKIDSYYKLRSVKLNNNSFSSIKKIINIYNANQININNNSKSEVNIVDYIKTTNTIIFLCKDEDYYFLKNEIIKNDKALNTALLKITISETNLNKLKNLGVKYKSITKIIDTNYLKSYLSLFSASSNESLINSNKAFYSFIDFLSDKNITNIKASPFLTVKNNINTSFSIVENIPYLTKAESIENNNKTESNTYTYKDVGLKIDILPNILKDKIDFDLNISIEDIIDNNSLTPKISKKYLKGSYTLHKNEILILSGINKNTFYEYESGIPILKDIPLFKYLFSWKSHSKLKSSLLITIEYVNSNKMNTNISAVSPALAGLTALPLSIY